MENVRAEMPSGSVVPNDVYRVVVTGSERRKTKKNDGELLALKFTIQQGEYAGQSITTNLNLWHQNTAARNMAKQEYGCMLKAMGIPPVQDTQQLHNIPVNITVVVAEYKKNDGTMGKTNNITDYAPVGQANNQQPNNPPAQNNQNNQQQDNTPPYA